MGKGYKDLIVWQKSMDLAENLYKITAKFPKSEMYGLSSQIRRAAISTPSNIAEGKQKATQRIRAFLKNRLWFWL